MTPSIWSADWDQSIDAFVPCRLTLMCTCISMGMLWYPDHTPATLDSTTTTPSPWNKPWVFPPWAKFTGSPILGTTTRTNQAAATSSHSVTTSVPTAMTPTTHPLNAPHPTNYAVTTCAASYHHTTSTLVLVAQWTLVVTSSTPSSTTITLDSWRMWTLTLEAIQEKLDAWKHQPRRGVML